MIPLPTLASLDQDKHVAAEVADTALMDVEALICANVVHDDVETGVSVDPDSCRSAPVESMLVRAEGLPTERREEEAEVYTVADQLLPDASQAYTVPAVVDA